MDTDELKKYVTDGFAEFGAVLKWEGDLKGFRRGDFLMYAELLELPDGAVVWATYQEWDPYGRSDDGLGSYRMNEPYRIARNTEEDCPVWSLSDGSSFGGEFSQSEEDEDRCVDTGGEKGVMYLYKAVPSGQT